MNLLYSAFDPVPWPKGSGTRIEATVRALAAAGARVHLHTTKPPHELPGFAETLETQNVTHEPVSIVGETFLDRALAFRQSVELLVASQDFQAAIFRSPWEGMPIIKSVPKVVYEAHGFPSVELPSHHPAVADQPQILDRLIGEENACLARASLYVTPSVTNRHFLMRRGAHPGKIHVISNSICPEEFAHFKQQPPPPPEPFRIGYMGTLAPWQGLHTLLEAVALIHKGLPCKIVIAGTRKGRWIRSMKKAARQLRVKRCLEFHGPLAKEDLNEVLQSCHVLAAPLPNDPRNSMQGCCPIKILEYMATSRPIISTRIPPVQEILEHERTGYLVQAGSSQSLAAGLLHLAREPELAAALAQNARDEVFKNYTRSRFNSQVEELWERIRLLKDA